MIYLQNDTLIIFHVCSILSQLSTTKAFKDGQLLNDYGIFLKSGIKLPV